MDFRFDAPVARVFALLTDAKFLQERCLAIGDIAAECKVRKGSGPMVTMKREARRELPSVLAKLFNPVSRFTIEEHWSGDDEEGRTGTYRFEIVGQPVSVSADITLQPEGKGSLYRIRHRCKARIPLVGGAVERFVLSQVEQGCRDELEYTAQALKKKAK